jgi:LysR family transcriptional regulator for metE and metH
MTEAIVEMVRFGMGITVMAEWAARQYLRTGGLATLPFRSDIGTRRWYACTHKDRSDSLSGLVGRMQAALLGTENPAAA